MTTTIIKTIGATGDYTTLQAWEDAAPANLVTVDQIWQGQLQNQTHSYSGVALTISGSTTDATRYKELTVVPGASFSDNANRATNALNFDTTLGALIWCSSGYSATIVSTENYARVSKLMVGSSAFSTDTLSVSGTGAQVSQCIAYGRGHLVLTISGTGAVASNTLAITLPSGGTQTGIRVSGNANVENCTSVAVGTPASGKAIGLDYSSGSTVRNSAAFGFPSAAIGNSSGATFINCFTDVAGGPAGYTVVTYDTTTGSGFVGIAAGSEDFRLVATSALINAGAASGYVSDIIGTARPSGAAYDVGAWEYVAAGGGSFSASTSEPVTGVEAVSSALVTIGAQSAALTSGDSGVASSTSAQSTTEAASGVDANSASLGPANWVASAAEAVAAVEVDAGQMSTATAIAEAGSASDVVAGTLGSVSYSVSLTEPLTVSDLVSALANLLAALTEASSASVSHGSSALAVAATVEGLAAGEGSVAVGVLASALVEVTTGTASSGGLMSSGAVVLETASAGDSASTGQMLVSLIGEVITAIELSGRSSTQGASVLEVGAASSWQNWSNSLLVSALEGLSVADQASLVKYMADPRFVVQSQTRLFSAIRQALRNSVQL
jgi:hypothetical protein